MSVILLDFSGVSAEGFSWILLVSDLEDYESMRGVLQMYLRFMDHIVGFIFLFVYFAIVYDVLPVIGTSMTTRRSLTPIWRIKGVLIDVRPVLHRACRLTALSNPNGICVGVEVVR